MAIAFALYDYVIEYNDGMTNKNKHTHTHALNNSKRANESTTRTQSKICSFRKSINKYIHCYKCDILLIL